MYDGRTRDSSCGGSYFHYLAQENLILIRAIELQVPGVNEVAKGLHLWVNLPKSHKMMEPR